MFDFRTILIICWRPFNFTLPGIYRLRSWIGDDHLVGDGFQHRVIESSDCCCLSVFGWCTSSQRQVTRFFEWLALERQWIFARYLFSFHSVHTFAWSDLLLHFFCFVCGAESFSLHNCTDAVICLGVDLKEREEGPFWLLWSFFATWTWMILSF